MVSLRVLVTAFVVFSILCMGCASRQSDISSSNRCRCLPDSPCWPTEAEWQSLGASLSGDLVNPKSPVASCILDANSAACRQALHSAQNPFTMESNPGAHMTIGWLGAWEASPATYAVVAESTADVAAAVKFARKHNLRLVIKGTGHDYLGRSSSPDSLLIWTHKMRDTEVHSDFQAHGCEIADGVPALSIGAGTRWLEAYTVATTEHARYVQGGGCTSVGAAGGFTQGGGFGSFSRQYGTGAGGILEVEIVTADGTVLIANRCQHEDLFWAIKGGGGGTFGVVTRMTLASHPLPEHFGIFQGAIKADSDESYRILLSRFLTFTRSKLLTEHWGEQIAFSNKNSIDFFLVFQGLSKGEADRQWESLRSWLEKSGKQYSFHRTVFEVPPHKMWDYQYWKTHHPELVTRDPAPGAPENRFWWTPNQGEVSYYWYTYQSRWIPMNLFEKNSIEKLTETLFKASRLTKLSLQINKGLAHASEAALKRERETSVNPVASESAALLIMSAGRQSVYPNIPSMGPDTKEAEERVQAINEAMDLIKEISPNSGAYVNEADYFENNWQEEFWGTNYTRLLAIKDQYDAHDLFWCHHCVGSEGWSRDGMCRLVD